MAISVSVVVWKKKKYILIYGGHCFGVGGWERAMAFRFFFFFFALQWGRTAFREE